MERNKARRSSLKSHHPDWKSKLRENCLRRVRDERQQLLWKLRATGQQDENQKASKDNAKSTFRDIVSDELLRIKQPSLTYSEGNLQSKNDDSLWEYDGVHVQNYSSEEDEELLIEMERVLYEDVKEESIRRELEHYDKEDEYLARVVFEHMQLNDDQNDKVWCPTCKQGELREARNLIFCTHCNLRLDLESDKVNLSFVRDRLGDVHVEHLSRGCRATPTFCLETVFGLTALYIRCRLCGTFEVVL